MMDLRDDGEDIAHELPQRLQSPSNKIAGVLLYTDEDTALALFVRDHLPALDALTGAWCVIYVIEAPSPAWLAIHPEDAAAILQPLGTAAGVPDSHPLDRSSAYTLGRQLGVLPDQFPCLVFVKDLAGPTTFVIPIPEVSVAIFRRMFATMERLLLAAGQQHAPGAPADAGAMFTTLVQNSGTILHTVAGAAIIQPTQTTVDEAQLTQLRALDATGRRFTGDERRGLEIALVEAFPTEGDLARMVRFELDEQLDVIVSPGSITAMVFELCNWCEAHTRMGDLLAGAIAANPSNLKLRLAITALTANVRPSVPPDPLASP